MKTIIEIEIEHKTELPDNMTDVLADRAYQAINAKGGFAGDVTARILSIEIEDLENEL